MLYQQLYYIDQQAGLEKWCVNWSEPLSSKTIDVFIKQKQQLSSRNMNDKMSPFQIGIMASRRPQMVSASSSSIISIIIIIHQALPGPVVKGSNRHCLSAPQLKLPIAWWRAAATAAATLGRGIQQINADPTKFSVTKRCLCRKATRDPYKQVSLVKLMIILYLVEKKKNFFAIF